MISVTQDPNRLLHKYRVWSPNSENKWDNVKKGIPPYNQDEGIAGTGMLFRYYPPR